MVNVRMYLFLIIISTLALSACKHIPRGNVTLPGRHAYLPHEQPALPSQVVLPHGDVVQVPSTCAERFALVQEALLQDMQSSPAPWIVAVLEHDAVAASDKEAVAALDKDAVAASDKDPAIQTGYAPAQDLLARITLEGDGVSKDSAKAFSLALDAARQGYIKSQILVASLYMVGHGIARDEEQAFHWLREAAHMDVLDTDAPDKGTSTKRSPNKNSPTRNSLSESTADQHDRAEAMLMLADAYRQGRGVAKDNEEAFLWSYKAAQAGSARALWWLGMHYYYGWGTPRDIELARTLLKPFADAGDAEALSILEGTK